MTCLPTFRGKRYPSLEAVKAAIAKEKSSREELTDSSGAREYHDAVLEAIENTTDLDEKEFIEHIATSINIFGNKLQGSVRYVNDENQPSAWIQKDGNIVINLAKMRPESLAHELAHIPILAIKLTNRPLFENLFDEALSTKEGRAILNRILSSGKLGNQINDTVKEELITTIVGLFTNNLVTEKSKEYNSIFKQIWKTIVEWFYNIFGPGYSPETLDVNLTLSDIASDLINAKYNFRTINKIWKDYFNYDASSEQSRTYMDAVTNNFLKEGKKIIPEYAIEQIRSREDLLSNLTAMRKNKIINTGNLRKGKNKLAGNKEIVAVASLLDSMVSTYAEIAEVPITTAYEKIIRNIVVSKKKTYVEFLDNGQAIVNLASGSNVASVVEEFVHIGRRIFMEVAKIDKGFGIEYAKILEDLGVEDGVWSVEQEELFAEYYKTFLYKNELAMPGLETMFTYISNLMKGVITMYNRGTLDEVNPELIRGFEMLLGKGLEKPSSTIKSLTIVDGLAEGAEVLLDKPFVNHISTVNDELAKSLIPSEKRKSRINLPIHNITPEDKALLNEFREAQSMFKGRMSTEEFKSKYRLWIGNKLNSLISHVEGAPFTDNPHSTTTLLTTSQAGDIYFKVANVEGNLVVYDIDSPVFNISSKDFVYNAIKKYSETIGLGELFKRVPKKDILEALSNEDKLVELLNISLLNSLHQSVSNQIKEKYPNGSKSITNTNSSLEYHRLVKLFEKTQTLDELAELLTDLSKKVDRYNKLKNDIHEGRTKDEILRGLFNTPEVTEMLQNLSFSNSNKSIYVTSNLNTVLSDIIKAKVFKTNPEWAKEDLYKYKFSTGASDPFIPTKISYSNPNFEYSEISEITNSLLPEVLNIVSGMDDVLNYNFEGGVKNFDIKIKGELIRMLNDYINDSLDVKEEDENENKGNATSILPPETKLSENQIDYLRTIIQDLESNSDIDSIWNNVKLQLSVIFGYNISEEGEFQINQDTMFTRLFDKDKVNSSNKESVRNILKLKMVTLHKLDENFDVVYNPISGLPTYVNFDKVLDDLRYYLAGATSEDAVLDILSELSVSEPSISTFYMELKSDKELLSATYGAFRGELTNSKYLDVRVNSEGYNSFFYRDSYDTPERELANEFANDIQAASNTTIKSVLSDLKNLQSHINSFKGKISPDGISTAIEMLANIYIELGLVKITSGVISSKISHDHSYKKVSMLDALYNSFINPLNVLLRSIEKNDGVFNNMGDLNRIAKEVAIYIAPVIDLSYTNPEGQKEFAIRDPNYVSDWFGKLKSFHIPDREAHREHLLMLFKNSPRFKNSNWRGSKTNPMLHLDKLDYHIFGGINYHDTNINSVYENVNSYAWKYAKLATYTSLFKSGGSNDRVIIPFPVQGSSSQMRMITTHRFRLGKRDLEGDKMNKLKKDSVLWNAIVDMVRQELQDMIQSAKVMFDNVDGEMLLRNFDQMPELLEHYHYSYDKKGNPVLVDGDGKVTGRSFQFHLIPELNNYDVFNSNGTLSIEKFREFSKSEDETNSLSAVISSFVENLLDEASEEYKDILSDINPSNYQDYYFHDEEFADKSKLLLAEHVLNEFIAHNEISNFIAGTAAEFASSEDRNKRLKLIISPRKSTGNSTQGVKKRVVVLEDIFYTSDMLQVFESKFKDKLSEKDWNSTVSNLTNIDTTDGVGVMSLSAAMKYEKEHGEWDKYSNFVEEFKDDKGVVKYRLKEGVKEEDVTNLFIIKKPFSFSREYSSTLNRLISKSLKYSVVVLNDFVVKDTPLKAISEFMEENNIDEVVFKSAVKFGMTGFANKVNWESDIKTQLQSAKVITIDNENWGEQVYIPQSKLDSDIKAPIQLLKNILANIPFNGEYTMANGIKIRGEELISRFQNVVSKLVELHSNELAEEIGDGSPLKIRGLIMKNASKVKFSTNELYGLGLDINGQFNVDLFFSLYANKLERLLLSIFEKRVTSFRIYGQHPILMTNALYRSTSKVDKKTLQKEYDSVTDKMISALDAYTDDRLNQEVSKEELKGKTVKNVNAKSSIFNMNRKLDNPIIDQKGRSYYTINAYWHSFRSDDVNYLDALTNPNITKEQIDKLISEYPEVTEFWIEDEYEYLRHSLNIALKSNNLILEALNDLSEDDNVYIHDKSNKNIYGKLLMEELSKLRTEYKSLLAQAKELSGKLHSITYTKELKMYYENGKLVAEAYMTPWSSKFFDNDGTLIPIHKIPEDVRYCLIHRIPYSGKQNSIYVKVIGWLSPGQGSVSQLPHELIGITSYDFDIDSTFDLHYNMYTTKDGTIKRYKSLTKEEAAKQLRVRYIREDRTSVTEDEFRKDISELIFKNNSKREVLENELLDLIITIQTSNLHVKDTVPLDYKQSEAIRDWLFEAYKEKERNFDNPVDQLHYQANNGISAKMIEISAAANTFAAVLQTVRAELGEHLSVKFKILASETSLSKLREEYGEDNVKIAGLYYEVSITNLAWNRNETFSNYSGSNKIRSTLGQLNDHSVDGVKSSLPEGITPTTFPIFFITSVTLGDFETAMYLVNQPILRLASKRALLDDYKKTGSTQSAYAYAKGYYQYKLFLLQGKHAKVNNTLRKKIAQKRRSDNYRNIIPDNYVKDLLGYDPNTAFIPSKEELKQNIESYGKNKENAAFYIQQLELLNFLEYLNKVGDKVLRYSKYLNTDKNGPGNSLSNTRVLTEGMVNMTILEDGEENNMDVLVNGIPILKAIYPKVFNDYSNQSKYKILETYLINSNLRAVDTFSKFFIHELPAIVEFKSKLANELNLNAKAIKALENRINEFILTTQLRTYPEFSKSQADARRILGIGMQDFKMPEVFSKDVFFKLPLAAKIRMAKVAIASDTLTIDSEIKNNVVALLNNLIPIIQPEGVAQYKFMAVKLSGNFENPIMNSQFIDTVSKMLYSQNEILQSIGEDIINYAILTTGFSSHKSSMSKAVPLQELMLNYNLKGILDSIKSKLNNNPEELNGLNVSAEVDSFIANNPNLAPIVKTRTYGENNQFLVWGTPNWTLNKDGVIAIPQESVYWSNVPMKVKESNYVRIQTYSKEKGSGFFLMKRIVREEVVYYYPINPMGTAIVIENGYKGESLFDENNIAKYTSEEYLGIINKMYDTYIGDKESKIQQELETKIKDYNKANGFNLPTTAPVKDRIKASVANAFIGLSNNPRSSTYKYLEYAKRQVPVNDQISPVPETIAFVSVEGTGEYVEDTIKLILKVIDAGGTVVMDASGTEWGESHSVHNYRGEGVVQDKLKELIGEPTGQIQGEQNYWGREIKKDVKSEIPIEKRSMSKETTTTKSTKKTIPIVTNKSINVYWSAPASATNSRILSNLAPRRFTYEGVEYRTVEQAYQILKSGTVNVAVKEYYDKLFKDKHDNYLSALPASKLKKSISKLQSKDFTYSKELMTELVRQSFLQNVGNNHPAIKELLKYDEFTHAQNSGIDLVFTKALKSVREEIIRSMNDKDTGQDNVQNKVYGDKAEYKEKLYWWAKYKGRFVEFSEEETRDKYHRLIKYFGKSAVKYPYKIADQDMWVIYVIRPTFDPDHVDTIEPSEFPSDNVYGKSDTKRWDQYDTYEEQYAAWWKSLSDDERRSEELRLDNNSEKLQAISQLPDETSTRTNKKVIRLRNMFSKLGVDVTVMIDNTLSTCGRITYDENGKVVILYNPRRVRTDTIYHEFGHLLVDLVGYDSTIVKLGIKELEGGKIWNQTMILYPQLYENNREKFEKEVLTTAIGVETTKLSNWFKRFLHRLLVALNLKSETVAMKLAIQLTSGRVAEKLNMDLETQIQHQVDLDNINIAENLADRVLVVMDNLNAVIHEIKRSPLKGDVTRLFTQDLNNIKDAYDVVTEYTLSDSYLSMVHAYKSDLNKLTVAEDMLDKLLNTYIYKKVSVAEMSEESKEQLGSDYYFLSLLHKSLSGLDEMIIPEADALLKQLETEGGFLFHEENRKVAAKTILDYKNLQPRVDKLGKELEKLTILFGNTILYDENVPEGSEVFMETLWNRMPDINKFQSWLDGPMDFHNNRFAVQLARLWNDASEKAKHEEVRINREFSAALRRALNVPDDTDIYKISKEEKMKLFDSIQDKYGMWITRLDYSKFIEAKDKFENELIAELGVGSKISRDDPEVKKAMRKWYNDKLKRSSSIEIKLAITNAKESMSKIEYDRWERKNFFIHNGKLMPRFGGLFIKPKTDEFINKTYANLTDRQLEFLEYIKDLSKELTAHYSGGIIQEGYGPAVAKKSSSNSSFITEEPSIDVVEDLFGEERLFLPFPYINKLAQKPILKYPSQLENQSDEEYEKQVMDYIYENYTIDETIGIPIVDLKSLKEYNAKIRSENRKTHGESLNRNLEHTMPLFIQAALKHKYFSKIEPRVRLGLSILKNSEYIQRNSWGSNLQVINKFRGNKQKDKTFAGEGSVLYNTMKTQIRMKFYDEFSKPAKYNKLARVLRSYNSLLGIGFNPFSAFKNIAYGTAMGAIEATAGVHYDGKDMAWALKFYNSAMTSYVTDGKRKDYSSSSLQGALMKEFDILQDQDELGRDEKSEMGVKHRAKHLFNDVAYLMQHSTEHFMQYNLLFCMLHSHRLVDGKILSLTEYIDSKLEKTDPYTKSYEENRNIISKNKEIRKNLKTEFETYKRISDLYVLSNDGYAVLKEGVEIPEKEFVDFKTKMNNVNRKLNGSYRSIDKGIGEHHTWWQLIIQFRHWARPGWTKRFGTTKGKLWNVGAKEPDIGDYKTFWRLIASPFYKESKLHFLGKHSDKSESEANALDAARAVLSGYKDLLARYKFHYHKLSLYEKASVRRAFTELVMIGMVTAISMLLALLHGGNDDDEKKLASLRGKLANATTEREKQRLEAQIEKLYKPQYLLNFFIYEFDAIKTELRTYVPFYGWLNEGKKMIASPAASFSNMENAIQLFNALLDYPLDKEGRVYKSGRYRKELKVKIKAIKMIPLINMIQRWNTLPDNNRYYKLWYGN